MKRLFALMMLMICFVHAEKPGSQFLEVAKSEDRRTQYFLAGTWFSSDDLGKTEYWAQKAASNDGADTYALLAQIKVTNPVSLDYPQAKTLMEKATQVGSKAGEITLTRILASTQAGHADYPKAITLLQNTSEDLESDSAVGAQMPLGLIYVNGAGIPVDDEEATWCFRHSSAISRTGYSEYWTRMMFLNSEQGFIVKNKQKALHQLNLSCTEGFDTGCEEFDKLANG